MHTVMEVETSVPAFLGKLWKLVEDPETDDLICWAPNGRSFFIRNPAQFARELLPHYYKHNNMASFVRQLNMYGFHKKVSVELGGLKCERDEMEFAHQYFIKDHPYLLEHIKRKIASSKTQDGHPPIKAEVMNKVLSEVRSMRGRQEHMDSRLGAMKRENEALWRELAMLRRKHLKQQEIVNKLIHFLVTLVQPSRSGGLSVKRRYPLMIDDHQRSKQMKVDKLVPEASPTGPVIHELDASEHEHHVDDLDSEYIVAEMLENHHPSVQSPESIVGLDDEHIETVHFSQNTTGKNDQTETQETSSKIKVALKPKKKRKNTVPVKILIPPTEIGEEPREETLMLEVYPSESTQPPTQLLEKKPSVKQQVKPIPIKTVRSSKLAAMAANINKLNDSSEADEDSDEIDNDLKEVVAAATVADDSESNSINLDDMFIIPDMLADTAATATSPANSEDAGEKNKQKSRGLGQDDTSNGNARHSGDKLKQEAPKPGPQSKTTTSNNNGGDAGSSSKTSNLSLSCVSPSSMSNSSYREEMDNHLEAMHNDLENLREMLRSEGYTIDANTLMELFGNNDPMSFGIPVNPELNPTHEKDDEDPIGANGATGGELMAYTPSNLLDFDDDMFLNTNNLGTECTDTQNSTNEFYNQEPLDLEDSKSLLLDSLVSGNGNSSANL
ncbi:heat shock factor protein isoform X2 [Microplitis demolitor]|uniref:heat shock factor protein isoform X2 n=1 Tax=Microplitis demolitor TaxID=69319 RepID=UPI0004CCAC21|nr:heat shock factor protein isoform X2 [Microplitis demolitor]